jgi:hypothetical protein
VVSLKFGRAEWIGDLPKRTTDTCSRKKMKPLVQTVYLRRLEIFDVQSVLREQLGNTQ